MNPIILGAVLMLCAGTGSAQSPAATTLAPQVDHHQHLLSPTLAAAWSEPVPTAIELPAELHRRFREKAPVFNDAAAIAELYTDDAVLSFADGSGGNWIRGRQKIATYLAGAFRRQYSLTPVAYRVDGSTGYIAGYLSGLPRHFHVLLSLNKGGYGAWRIAAQSITLVPPATLPLTADHLIAHGSPSIRGNDEYAKVQAENDWTSQQVAQYPDRLRAFCSFNPLREYALAELDRCAKDPNLRLGLKLHLANSQVDLRNSGHVEQLRGVFRAANAHRMPIVVHLWTGRTYGRADAEIFLNEVLPAAPDIPIQIAHLAGAGPGLAPGSQEALIVFAEAVAAADPRTRTLYFDVTTNVTIQTSAEDARFIADRLRQIGLKRILYGSDMAIGGNPPAARQSWGAFRAMLPLTEAEFRTIAANVAPYMR